MSRWYDVLVVRDDGSTKTVRVQGNTRSFARRLAFSKHERERRGNEPIAVSTRAPRFVPESERGGSS